jgi:hypothetical protein
MPFTDKQLTDHILNDGLFLITSLHTNCDLFIVVCEDKEMNFELNGIDLSGDVYVVNLPFREQSIEELFSSLAEAGHEVELLPARFCKVCMHYAPVRGVHNIRDNENYCSEECAKNLIEEHSLIMLKQYGLLYECSW